MSREELRAFFLAQLEKVGAAQIARDTGYSDSTVSQVKHGKYKGDENAFLSKVATVYGRWLCPIDDEEIDYKACSEEQARPYSAARVRRWATCQKCDRRST